MSENYQTTDSSPNGDPARSVDLNTAGLEELTTIPGVGPTMASRIQAARPFDAIEDLVRVSGIGPVTLERMRPYLSLTANDDFAALVEKEVTTSMPFVEAELAPVEEEVEVEALEEGLVTIEPEPEEAVPAAEMEPADVELPEGALVDMAAPEAPELEEAEEEAATIEAEVAPGMPEVIEKKPPEEQPAPRPRAEPAMPAKNFVTRSQAFWMAMGAGLLALLLALALSLGILASINNGGLEYASPAQILELNRRLDGVRSQADILQGDLTGLRERVDNLEALGGRLSAVENATGQLTTDLTETRDQVANIQQQAASLSAQVEEVGAQVENLQAESDQVQNFITRLRDLLNEIFIPEGTP